jgi:hypothetical protein
MVTDAGSAAPAWSPVRIFGLLLITVVLGVAFYVAGRALLEADDDDPELGLVEQSVFRRLVVIPDDAIVVVEPAWAATYYGSVLIEPDHAAQLVPDGTYVPGDPDVANAPAFSYVQYTVAGDFTCLAYADLHDPEHPSPLVPVERLEPEARATFESGQRLLANIGTICGAEDRFPNR